MDVNVATAFLHHGGCRASAGGGRQAALAETERSAAQIPANLESICTHAHKPQSAQAQVMSSLAKRSGAE